MDQHSGSQEGGEHEVLPEVDASGTATQKRWWRRPRFILYAGALLAVVVMLVVVDLRQLRGERLEREDAAASEAADRDDLSDGTTDAARGVETAIALAMEQWSADLAASPLGLCVETVDYWMVPLGEAITTDQSAYGVLFNEMTMSVGSQSPEWDIINQGAGVYARTSLAQGRAEGLAIAFDVMQNGCVAAHGTAEQNVGPVPGVDPTAAPQSPLPAATHSASVGEQTADVEAFLANLAEATNAFAGERDEDQVARGWGACALLEPDPTAAHPMGPDDLSEHPSLSEVGGEELFTAAAGFLCPQHEWVVEEAVALRRDLDGGEDRSDLAPDLPDWAFEDPERVARTVMDAYVAGDRDAVEMLIAGELLEGEWTGMDPLQNPEPSCEPDGEFARVCSFDEGIYVVFLAQDRVTEQWIARYVDDFSGV